MSTARKMAPPEELRRLLSFAAEKAWAVPRPRVGDRQSFVAYRADVRQLAEELRANGFRITENFKGARVRVASITATGTGMERAILNWIVAARKRLDAEGGE